MSSLEAAVAPQFPNDGYLIDSEITQKIGYRRKEDIGKVGDFDSGFRLVWMDTNFTS